MAAPDIAGEFDCEESPKTKAIEESLQNCCIVPEIRKERRTHGLQVHCRLCLRLSDSRHLELCGVHC
jgi:hypothetical protein